MKKIVFLVLLVVLHISTFAQNNQEKKLPGYKTSFETNKFWDNWFISLNLGAQTLYAEGSTDAKFGDRLTFMPACLLVNGLRLGGDESSRFGRCFTWFSK